MLRTKNPPEISLACFGGRSPAVLEKLKAKALYFGSHTYEQAVADIKDWDGKSAFPYRCLFCNAGCHIGCNPTVPPTCRSWLTITRRARNGRSHRLCNRPVVESVVVPSVELLLVPLLLMEPHRARLFRGPLRPLHLLQCPQRRRRPEKRPKSS